MSNPPRKVADKASPGGVAIRSALSPVVDKPALIRAVRALMVESGLGEGEATDALDVLLGRRAPVEAIPLDTLCAVAFHMLHNLKAVQGELKRGDRARILADCAAMRGKVGYGYDDFRKTYEAWNKRRRAAEQAEAMAKIDHMNRRIAARTAK